jgi:hypothetical protein
MNRYDSFNIFMVDLIKAANTACDLNELFEVKGSDVVEIIIEIIRQGWWVFTALTVVLSLSGLAFGASVSAFLMSPPGMIIALIVGASVSVTLWSLYRNRKLPLAIKEVGSQCKPLYEKLHENENNVAVRCQKIDELLEYGAVALVSKAKHLSYQQKQELRSSIRSFFGM